MQLARGVNVPLVSRRHMHGCRVKYATQKLSPKPSVATAFFGAVATVPVPVTPRLSGFRVQMSANIAKRKKSKAVDNLVVLLIWLLMERLIRRSHVISCFILLDGVCLCQSASIQY